MSASDHTHFEILPNGMTLLLREAHLAPVVDLQVWALVGSADERDGEHGLAHFHEHMLFKGTPRRGVGEVAGEIEGAGGRINAYTSFDTTVYYATLPIERIDTGIDVLSDAIRYSLFDPTEIEREIEVVLEEIRRSDDAPMHVLGDAVFREAYRVHPYRAPILGPPDSVASFDRDKVRAFFERWYAPDNLMFVAAGDFDARDVAARIREAWGDAEPRGATRDRPVEPPRDGLRQIVLERPFERVKLDLSWSAPAFRSPDATYLDLLSFSLGECESSRLVQRVKERDGLVDRIDSGAYTPLDPGLFSVTIDVDGDRAADAISAVTAEVERLREQPVGDDELERARANFLSTEHFERESVSGLARKLGGFHALGGDWRGEERYFELIRSATPRDLQRVAREYLRTDQLTVGALLPEGEKAALDEPTIERAVAAGVERTRRAFAVPRHGAASSGVESYELEGGASVHVLRRPEVPVVSVRAAFRGGLLAETEANAGLTHFLTSMWMRGTASHSSADFARSVENLAADIDAFSGRNSLGLTCDVTSDKLEPALDLFAEVLLEPGFDPEEIERERRETLAALDRREDRLAQLAYLQFARTLFEQHPYRLPMLGERESVERFDLQALTDFHGSLIRAENLVVGVAGDVDPDRIAAEVSNRLSGLPAGGFHLPESSIEAAPESIREAHLRKDRAQAHLVLGFQGLSVSDPDRFALEVIAQLLAGQGGRLFLELRDKRSLAYSVNALNIEGLAPGFFSVYIATAPEKVEEARSGILEELGKLLEAPIPAPELDRAIRYLCGNFAIDQQRASTRAAHIALDALYGLGPDAEQHYVESISSVTAEDVRRVATQVLRLDAYTLSVVEP